MCVSVITVVLCWSVVNFNFYFFSFSTKYLAGGIFTDSLTLSSADIISCASAGFFARAFGSKRSLFCSFLAAAIFAFVNALFAHHGSWAILGTLLLTRLGSTGGFIFAYLVTAEAFPPMYRSRIFSLCYVFGGVLCALAPVIAELIHFDPCFLLGCSASVGAVGTFGIKYYQA